jgi:hypothetical protein
MPRPLHRFFETIEAVLAKDITAKTYKRTKTDNTSEKQCNGLEFGTLSK